jgi:hypothetical protein
MRPLPASIFVDGISEDFNLLRCCGRLRLGCRADPEKRRETGPIGEAQQRITMPDSDTLDDLKDSVRTIKKEVDALQIAVTNQNKAWYADGSNLIAILALLFSFGTTFVSYRKSVQQDVENLRGELRSLLQRIAELPKVNAEVFAKFKDAPDVQATLSGYINQENEFLAIQAAEIAKQLPPDRVSPVEYYAVALALGNSYKIEQERQFISMAITAASEKDFNTEVSGLRTNGNLLFVMGKPEEGRVEFQKALSIFSKYPNFDDFTIKSTHVYTELAWAYAEMAQRSMAEVEQHIRNAESIVGGLTPGPGTDQLRAQTNMARQRLTGAMIGALPPPTGLPPPLGTR